MDELNKVYVVTFFHYGKNDEIVDSVWGVYHKAMSYIMDKGFTFEGVEKSFLDGQTEFEAWIDPENPNHNVYKIYEKELNAPGL